MQDLVAEINRALRARRWSARRASVEAVGSPDLVRDMRRGFVTSVEKFRALCDVLGLEFYVGPPRKDHAVDEQRLEVAIETAVRTLRDTGIALDPSEEAQVIASVYHLIGPQRSPATTARVKRLIAALTSTKQPQGEG